MLHKRHYLLVLIPVGLLLAGLMLLAGAVSAETNTPQRTTASLTCSNTMAVNNTAELNDAIACFNAQTAGTHTIEVMASIVLTAATTAIDNSSSAELIVTGKTPSFELGYDFIYGRNPATDGPSSHRIFTVTNGNVTIEKLFVGLGSADFGGGIRVDGGVVTLREVILIGNTATDSGGGIYNNGATVTIADSSFITNSVANDGGGISNVAGGMMTITNSTFDANVASGSGAFNSGGAINNFGGTLDVSRSAFINNHADQIGGAIQNPPASTTSVQNSTFVSNTAPTRGSTIQNEGTFTLTHVTIVDETAAGQANGVLSNHTGMASFTVKSSILAFTAGNGCKLSSGADPISFTNSLVQIGDSCSVTHDTSGNKTGDPQLGTLDNHGGDTLVYSLQMGSPAINPINNVNCLAVDQRGFLRYDGMCDMGAFEKSEGRCFATHLGSAEQAVSLDASAVMSATQAAGAGGTVKVAGTCSGVQAQTTMTGTITQTVYLIQSLTLEGGHTPADWAAAPDSSLYPTVLDARGQGSVVVIHNVAGTGTIDVTIEHLTLRNGLINSGGFLPFRQRGGGIFVGTATQLILKNSLVEANAARQGGGIYNSGAVTVRNSVLSGNSAEDGGGIYNFGTATVSNSVLSGNSAEDGGGIYTYDSGTTMVISSTLSGNLAESDGGGLFNRGTSTTKATATVSNSTLSNNSAGSDGGGVFSSGTVTVSNSTLSGNSAVRNGGGILNSYGSTTAVSNSTLSDNSAGSDGGGLYNRNTTAVSNSTLSGNSAGNDGGGLYNRSTVAITHTTIVSNSAPTGAGIASVDGSDDPVSTTLRASIVAGNVGGGNDLDLVVNNDEPTNSFQSNNFNLIGTLGSDVVMAGANDTVTTTSQVEPLANNGGPTLTHKLLLGSSAIDAVTDGNCPATDQRGYGRVGTCDIGSYEHMAAPVPLAVGLVEGEVEAFMPLAFALVGVLLMVTGGAVFGRKRSTTAP